MAITLVQSVYNTSTTKVLPAAPTPGNTLIGWMVERNVLPATPPGFTSIAGVTNEVVGPGSQRWGRMVYRVVQPGDGASWSDWSGPNNGAILMEWSGGVYSGIFATITGTAGTSSTTIPCGGSVTPPAGIASMAIGGSLPCAGDDAAKTISPNDGATELVDDKPAGFAPQIWCGYRTLTAAGTVSGTMSSADTHAGVTILLVENAPPAEPGAVNFEVCGPLGTNCVVIERPIEQKVRIEYNGEGTGFMRLSRYDAQATSTILARGNRVRVTIPEIHPTPIFEFLIESGDFEILSGDEEGGEILSFGGPGSLSVLRHAIMWNTETEGALGHVKPAEDVWRFSELWTAARLMTKMLAEAQARSPDPLLGLTDTFDNATDSDGVAWPSAAADVLDGEYEVPIGSDLYTEFQRLVANSTIRIAMDPGMVLNAWVSQGRDLSGAFGSATVRFEKGVNIASELTRQMSGKVWGSKALIKRKGGYSTSSISDIPFRYEVFVDSSQTSGSQTAIRQAARRLLRGSLAQEATLVAVTPYGPRGEVNLPGSGFYFPGPTWSANGRYWVGDLVTLHTGTGNHDYNAVTKRIYGIELYTDETGALAPPIVELDAPYIQPGAANPAAAAAVSTGSGSVAPESSGSTAHSHTQYQLASGDRWKQPVRVATTVNGTLATAFENGDTIDGIVLATGDRLLIKDQTAGAENGIYVVAATGAPLRATDLDETGEVVGSLVYVVQGTANGGRVFRNTNTTEPVIGTTAITWAESGSGVASIELVIDGGGSVITTGIKGFVEVPFACTITAVRLLADVSGSIVVDIWKDTYANYPPTVADTITAAAKPTISGANKSQDTTLTGWTIAIAAGDILGFNVDSATTVTRVTLSLTVRRT